MVATERLRTLAERIGLRFGTCVNLNALENDPAYAKIIGEEFNLITPENALKFSLLSPAKGVYNFEAADKLIAFAEKHQMEFRGHVLVWEDQIPKWLLSGNYSRTELVGILNDYIETVVGRYAGKIKAWDVVNEAVNDAGAFKKTFWHERIGPEYIEIAFHAARRADPFAKLFYNDYGAEGSFAHEDGVYRMVKSLKSKAVPIDGVGFQMHLSLEGMRRPTIDSVNIQRLTDLGLESDITELDIRMRTDEGPSDRKLAAQAQMYADVFNTYVVEKGCRTFTLWGFTDRYSWVPFFYPNEGNATLMTEDFTPKTAYWQLMTALKKCL